jgi:hypothetical protein
LQPFEAWDGKDALDSKSNQPGSIPTPDANTYAVPILIKAEGKTTTDHISSKFDIQSKLPE